MKPYSLLSLCWSMGGTGFLQALATERILLRWPASGKDVATMSEVKFVRE